MSYSDEYLKVSVKNLTNKQIKNLRGKNYKSFTSQNRKPSITIKITSLMFGWIKNLKKGLNKSSKKINEGLTKFSNQKN